MKKIQQLSKLFVMIAFSCIHISCLSCNDGGDSSTTTPNPIPIVKNEVDFWLTKGDQSVLLKKQNGILGFGTTPNNFAAIEVNPSVTYQTIDGFGYTLTGGSAQVINNMTASGKKELLQELFGKNETSISISYLRISVGASDLNASPFTYNDIPYGDTDFNLTKFSLEKDKGTVIALLKEILAINPAIKILATPWTAPVWMKDKNSFVGGHLKTVYYQTYADYLVKYIKAMKAEGIAIDAITPQNEPLHGGNNPSMEMLATEQTDFIKNNLGPAFQKADITTKIIAYDHNCDNTQYAVTVLSDATANTFVDGSAFHLYAGDISALSFLHNKFPTKNVYFTEQYTSSNADFKGDLKWHLKNVIIGSMRNWSKNALEWNLANDGSFGPHTDGGCTICKGAITINSSEAFDRNVAYYIIGHASKFVPAGSVRIETPIVGNLQNVAFKTPAGKIVLIVENDGDAAQNFNIKHNGKWITTGLDAGAVGTYTW